MAEVAVFYRWRPCDLDDMDWGDLVAYHASLRRMTARLPTGTAG